MERRFASDGIELVGHLARPSGSSPPRATVVLCHGYPDASVGSAGAGGDLGELADRIASTMGWLAFTFSFRGCGASGGNFSLSGWMHDIVAAADELRDTEGVDELWLVGFGTGGGLSLGAAVEMGPRVLGVATLAAPAGFDDWGTHTRRLLQHSRDVGVIRDASFPQAADAWAKEFRVIRPVDDAARLAELPMLVVHGSPIAGGFLEARVEGWPGVVHVLGPDWLVPTLAAAPRGTDAANAFRVAVRVEQVLKPYR